MTPDLTWYKFWKMTTFCIRDTYLTTQESKRVKYWRPRHTWHDISNGSKEYSTHSLCRHGVLLPNGYVMIFNWALAISYCENASIKISPSFQRQDINIHTPKINYSKLRLHQIYNSSKHKVNQWAIAGITDRFWNRRNVLSLFRFYS